MTDYTKDMHIVATFKGAGDFQAYRMAEEWCRENGYSIGLMSNPYPTALIKGDFQIAKWKNLTNLERTQVDGVIYGDFCEGPIVIKLKK